ncbi:MAG: class I adenylate-forming enzyme family protein [Neoaquamicrobium sediminum]|uniref:class I adenylate-forming enzyme family protein n=1 Tax=Neoaquamicrobium sediminum TaxID=1849104 RepID=UPI004035CEBF
MNLADWLDATARAKPDAPAIFEGTELYATYAGFAARVRALAAGLQAAHDLKAGDRVAVFMKNCPAYLELFYAVWWFGGTIVPINSKLHPREAAWIVGDAGATVLVCDGDGLGADAGMPADCAQIAVGSTQWSALFEQGEGDTVPARVSGDDIAWLFYTSGTTGRPKGVMLTHWNMRVATLAYALDVDQPAPDQATIYAAPISHGAGIYNFVFVRVGGSHVFPLSRGFDPAEIEALSGHFGQTVMFAAPTMVKRMIEAAKASGYRGEGIRTVVYGGGPMYAADIDEALSLFGPRFVQIYGQGETPMTITSLTRELVADETHPQWRERRASVGQAMSCVEVRIAQDGEDVQPGEAGEILVRGATVMKGYWRNEKATAETLRDGWLHTGDIGRLDEDGFLTLTDRAKDLIISGGTNIYPREVEEVVARHPGVLEVSVVGQPSAEWGEDVVAFVVPRGEGACDARVLDAWCRAEMASFKKPKRYVFCAELPKNSYGKVLKTELRKRLG